MFLMFGRVFKFEHLVMISEKYFSEFSKLTKKDHFFVYTGIDLMRDERTVRWLEERPFSTLLLDADSEVFRYYSEVETVRKFGGTVHKLSDSVYHFAKSGVYRINGRKLLIANIGSRKASRERSYHMFCSAQFKKLLDSAENNNNKVDYVISTLPPNRLSKHFSGVNHSDIYSLYMDEILRRCEFQEWYFAHTDNDIDFENFHSVYRSVIEIDGKILTDCSGTGVECNDYL